MTSPSAKVIADSLSPQGDRLTTFEGTLHRWVLAELNTHRAFSRNSASSRAIPFKKQVEKVMNDPALPLEWGSNKSGMQAGEPLSEDEAYWARHAWLAARDHAVTAAMALDDLGLHKQWVNRLIEPHMWHTVIISSTEAGLQNFFDQRCTSRSPLAQPEIRAFADAVLAAYEASTPVELALGEWHTPYIQPDEDFELEDRKKISVARCARVSYLTHDGVRDPAVDLGLYEKLIGAKPPHWSPTEHVATPLDIYSDRGYGWAPAIAPGNFDGWVQLRHSRG